MTGNSANLNGNVHRLLKPPRQRANKDNLQWLAHKCHEHAAEAVEFLVSVVRGAMMPARGSQLHSRLWAMPTAGHRSRPA